MFDQGIVLIFIADVVIHVIIRTDSRREKEKCFASYISRGRRGALMLSTEVCDNNLHAKPHTMHFIPLRQFFYVISMT